MLSMGEKIRRAREARGLLQAELAQKIGVRSGGVISNWENNLNQPSADKISRLCEALSLSPAYLLGCTDKGDGLVLTPPETEFIEKYRALDPRGRAVVAGALELEASFSKGEKNLKAASSPATYAPREGRSSLFSGEAAVAARGGGVKAATERQKRDADLVIEAIQKEKNKKSKKQRM